MFPLVTAEYHPLSRFRCLKTHTLTWKQTHTHTRVLSCSQPSLTKIYTIKRDPGGGQLIQGHWEHAAAEHTFYSRDSVSVQATVQGYKIVNIFVFACVKQTSLLHLCTFVSIQIPKTWYIYIYIYIFFFFLADRCETPV